MYFAGSVGEEKNEPVSGPVTLGLPVSWIWPLTLAVPGVI